MPGAQPRSASVAKVKDSSGRAAKPPLGVTPISVWSPPAHSTEPPPLIDEDLGRKRPEADGDEVSLLSNAELAAGAISSILRDFDLKRSGALPIEEALSLSLKGVASVSSYVLIFFALILVLSCVLTLCWVSVGDYPSEEFGKKGQTKRGLCQSRQSLQS